MIFAAILMGVTFLTGAVWLIDKLFLREGKLKNNKIIENIKGFFPVLLAVFIIRSFIVEPFKIPSGSMMPTLVAGDFIAVNKFSYGLRLPVFNKLIFSLGQPKRGDVFVFHYPEDPSIDYIKRLIGLPGDKIRYEDKVLYINDERINQSYEGAYDYFLASSRPMSASKKREILGNSEYSILIHDIPDENYNFVVPDKHYLAIGDNRDNSSDSRVWGYVPEKYLVGKAFMIWLNFDNFSRIGDSIQ
jgi:signal peptidase I